MQTLGHDPNTARLRFDSHQDALDFARDCVERSKCLFVGDNFCERYKKSEIELCVELSIVSSDEKFHLIFSAIPDPRSLKLFEGYRYRASGSTNFPMQGDRHGCKRKNESMLVSVASEVQCCEDVVPSLVRLQPSKKRQNLSRNIGAAFKGVFKGESTSSEWKVSRVDAFSGKSSGSDGKHRMVKGRPDIVYGISSDHGELARKGMFQAEFMNRLIGLVRVWLSNNFAGAYFQEDADLPFEFGNVFPTPCEFLMGTGE